MEVEGCSDVVYSNDVELMTSGIYGLLSLLLYLRLIVVILKRSSFHHPFFYQFILLSVSNIWLWFDIFIIQRVIPHKAGVSISPDNCLQAFCDLLHPRFVAPTPILKPLVVSYYLPVAIQLFTVMVISVNRMTVILSPISATQFWSRHGRWILLGVLIASSSYTFYLYDWNGSLQVTDGRLGLTFVEGWPHIPLALMAAIVSTTCLVGIILSGGISLFFLVRSNITNTKEAEVNLFWTNVGFSVTTGVLSFYMLMIYLFYYKNYTEEVAFRMITFRGWVFDVNCLLPAWLLVFTNRQIRERLLLSFGSNKAEPATRVSKEADNKT